MTNARRRLLLGLLAVPVAASTVALATADTEAGADESLIAACERFLVLEDAALSAEAGTDRDDTGAEQTALVEMIIVTQATTVAGLRAKAQVMQVYATPSADAELSAADRLLQALLRDIVGDADACSPAATTRSI